MRQSTIQTLARAGLSPRGIVYLLIGVLAAMWASGQGGEVTGGKGAIYGVILLAIIALGLAAHSDFFPPLAPAGSAEIVPITSDPGGTVSTIAFSYWLMLRAARDRVWITTPYFLPSSDIEDALTSAAGRGTDVALLLPGSHNDHKAIQYGGRTYYRRLVEAGIRLYEFVQTMIHTKSIVVDRDLAIIGSSNFDNRSFDLNYEIALCVSDPALNRALAEQFEADLEHARRITIEHLDAEHGLASTIRDHAMLPLRPLL
jgi:cardiolipin synthase